MNGVELAAGSIVGRSHTGRGNLLLGGNNQDAFTIHREEDLLIAVVADGCSSGEGSEVGSQIGSTLYASALRKEWRGSPSLPHSFWQRVDRRALASISTLAESLVLPGSSFEEVIGRCFLFTVLGFIHSPQGSWVFRLGGADGVIAINGEVEVLHPQEGNEPGYAAYQLVRTKFSETPELSSLQLHRFIPPGEMISILIATDGATELLSKEHSMIPGTSDPVGPLARLWQEDAFFEDASALPRFLRQVNSEVALLDRSGTVPRLRRDRGLLSDDTTIVVARNSMKGTTP